MYKSLVQIEWYRLKLCRIVVYLSFKHEHEFRYYCVSVYYRLLNHIFEYRRSYEVKIRFIQTSLGGPFSYISSKMDSYFSMDKMTIYMYWQININYCNWLISKYVYWHTIISKLMFTLEWQVNYKSCIILTYIIQFVQGFCTKFFLRNFYRPPIFILSQKMYPKVRNKKRHGR